MRSEGESTQLVTRRLSLRTQLRAGYGIYTKGDVAKDNTRTIDIQREAEQPLGTGAAVGNSDSDAYDNKLQDNSRSRHAPEKLAQPSRPESRALRSWYDNTAG
jgi:hypothetical protein